jgi:parallel beta-helix repeat protein
MKQDKSHEFKGASSNHMHRRRYMGRIAAVMGTTGIGLGVIGSAAADDDETTEHANENGFEEKELVEQEEWPDTVANESEISECTTITESGEYTLVQDIAPPEETGCIIIEADDVTFDGGGNTISGGNPAVFIFGDNVTVQNLRLADNRFGIIAIDVNNACIADNTVEETENIGIQLSGGTTESTVTRNTVTENGTGILLDDATENVVSDNTATNNGNGIVLQFGANNNEATGNDASDNDGNGIFLLQSDNNTITQNTANNNGDFGINLIESNNNVVTENTVADINDQGEGNTFEGNVGTGGSPPPINT